LAVLAFVAHFRAAVQGTLAWVASGWAILTSLAERFAAVIFLGATITLAAFSRALSTVAWVTARGGFRAVLALVTCFHAAVHGALARLAARGTVLAAFTGSFATGVFGAAITIAALS